MPGMPLAAWGIGRCGKVLSEKFSNVPVRGTEEQDTTGAVSLLVFLCAPGSLAWSCCQ